ncbi:hypothetical protein OPT61_g2450 [Boeremia exigua]|uniref:Uncharacterized protein n=1 Tax=Boeremia exigua TaxID=749465 RepID=A0ACC2ILI4_9PLEO|nr:hypothetical protein OPT61_g2450 [Boeremia exigua]
MTERKTFRWLTDTCKRIFVDRGQRGAIVSWPWQLSFDSGLCESVKLRDDATSASAMYIRILLYGRFELPPMVDLEDFYMDTNELPPKSSHSEKLLFGKPLGSAAQGGFGVGFGRLETFVCARGEWRRREHWFNTSDPAMIKYCLGCSTFTSANKSMMEPKYKNFCQQRSGKLQSLSVADVDLRPAVASQRILPPHWTVDLINALALRDGLAGSGPTFDGEEAVDAISAQAKELTETATVRSSCRACGAVEHQRPGICEDTRTRCTLVGQVLELTVSHRRLVCLSAKEVDEGPKARYQNAQTPKMSTTPQASRYKMKALDNTASPPCHTRPGCRLKLTRSLRASAAEVDHLQRLCHSQSPSSTDASSRRRHTHVSYSPLRLHQQDRRRNALRHWFFGFMGFRVLLMLRVVDAGYLNTEDDTNFTTDLPGLFYGGTLEHWNSSRKLFFIYLLVMMPAAAYPWPIHEGHMSLENSPPRLTIQVLAPPPINAPQTCRWSIRTEPQSVRSVDRVRISSTRSSDCSNGVWPETTALIIHTSCVDRANIKYVHRIRRGSGGQLEETKVIFRFKSRTPAAAEYIQASIIGHGLRAPAYYADACSLGPLRASIGADWLKCRSDRQALRSRKPHRSTSRPPSPAAYAITRRDGQESQVSHHHGAPHIDGHDWLLPDNAAAARAPATEHAQIRPDRHGGTARAWQASRQIRERQIRDPYRTPNVGRYHIIEDIEGYKMKPTLEAVHSVLRLAKGLTVASYNANMDSRKNSEKSQDEHFENAPFPRSSSPHHTPASSHEGKVVKEEGADSKGGLLGTFQKMGNLPEWNVPGFGRLRGKALNNGIAWASWLAFLMFGYDQGVMSGLLTLNDFQRHFPLMTPLSRANDICWFDVPDNTVRNEQMCTGDSNTQAAAVALYQVGCFLGAVLVLFYGEVWGRKSSTFWGSFIMIVGTIFQVAAGGTNGGDAGAYAILIVGRIVGGIGNGMVTSTIPTWQSECAKPEQRGRLIITSGAIITAGIMISYWVGYGFYFLPAGAGYSSVRWRFPVMFQSFFTIIVMYMLLYLPDSPRWLVMRGREEEARELLARLSDEDVNSETVGLELSNINEALAAQSALGEFKMRELLTNGPSQNLRRTLLGIFGQLFQQISGINLITYYATFVFENSLGFGPDMSRLLAALNGTEYFLAALIAIPLIERVGRRRLMLFGAFGQMVSMIILSGSSSTAVIDELGAPRLNTLYGVLATVFLFGFNTFFAIGWLGMAWLYPAEITNLRIRIQANALSTCSNWLSNFLIVMITPICFANLQYNTYTMFAVFNAALLPTVYFFFPEPKGRSLEELDVIFAKAHAEGVSPVKMAKNMPKLEGRDLDLEIARYWGEDVEQMRRRSITSMQERERRRSSMGARV